MISKASPCYALCVYTNISQLVGFDSWLGHFSVVSMTAVTSMASGPPGEANVNCHIIGEGPSETSVAYTFTCEV